MDKTKFFVEHDELVEKWEKKELSDEAFWYAEKSLERKYQLFEYKKR